MICGSGYLCVLFDFYAAFRTRVLPRVTDISYQQPKRRTMQHVCSLGRPHRIVEVRLPSSSETLFVCYKRHETDHAASANASPMGRCMSNPIGIRSSNHSVNAEVISSRASRPLVLKTFQVYHLLGHSAAPSLSLTGLTARSR